MIRSWKLLIPLLLSSAALLTAQVPSHDARLVTAFTLHDQGLPQQAIATAQSLIDAHALSRLDEARALDLEAMSYQDLDEPEKAIHALEAARHLLGPQDTKELASVYDNLGSVYTDRGDLKAAARLFGQAFALYEAGADHDGMARVANNQAGVALVRRHNAEARQYLERADREASQTKTLDNDDLAAISSMDGWLAASEGDAKTALRDVERSLQLWQTAHGMRHPLTAWGMVLVGQTQTRTGAWEAGITNLRQGLALMGATVGERNRRYVAAEMAYSRALDHIGDKSQADWLREDAEMKLSMMPGQGLPGHGMPGQGCDDCTISVLALR